jgi:hypothetical protein
VVRKTKGKLFIATMVVWRGTEAMIGGRMGGVYDERWTDA